MDINSDAKRLAAMFGGAAEGPASPLIGKYVIVRDLRKEVD